MNAATQIEAFLDRVLDWPGADAPGFVNLHTNSPNQTPSDTSKANNEGKPFMTGYPFKTRQEFLDKARSIAAYVPGMAQGTWPWLFNSWFCMSKQSSTKINKAGKVRAVKGRATAMSLKAIWLDIDIKVGAEHYNTLLDAQTALLAFITKVGLPKPTALVNSGGGLHVYWISDVALTPAEWMPHAEGLKSLALIEGLKCDAGLTADSARLLRVPGTFNHKYDPPAPVTLLKLADQDINFANDMAFLSLVPRVGNSSVTAAVSRPSRKADIDPSFNTPMPDYLKVFNAANATTADLGKVQERLDDPAPILEKCGFYASMLANGGAGIDNALWNLAILGTTFMENGNEVAHQISKGWVSQDGGSAYSQEGTQAQFERKLAERANSGISGPPTCGAIEGAGCKDCASCPLKSKIKTPLSIKPSAVAVTQTAQANANLNRAPDAALLPEDYDLDKDGYVIHRLIRVDKFGVDHPIETKVLLVKLDVAACWVQKDPDILHVHFEADRGNKKVALLRAGDMAGNGAQQVWHKQGLLTKPSERMKAEDLWVSFMSKMWAAAQATQAVGFGWQRDEGERIGFAYGGTIQMTDGTSKQAGFADREMASRFSCEGSIDPWYNAWSYIQRQSHPQLEICVAVAFAAPIMEMTGYNGAMMAIVGQKGCGKTYATELACAVWGHPLKTKEGAESTSKSVIERLGTTNNLPAFWDEISTEELMKIALRFLNMTTGGVNGSRLNSDISQQGRKTWSTIVALNGNKDFKEYIVKMEPDHGASLMRCLQTWIVKRPEGSPGQVKNTMEPQQALAKLNHNHGLVGKEYSRFIAVNHKLIEQMVTDVGARLNDELECTQEERFWQALITAVLVGAQVANMMDRPIGFDVAGIENELKKCYLDNRLHQANAGVNPSTETYAETYLGAFINDRLNETIRVEKSTEIVPTGARPAAANWSRLTPNATFAHGIQIRLDRNDMTLQISKLHFESWLRLDPNRSPAAIVKALKSIYNMYQKRGVLAAGTPMQSLQNQLYVIEAKGFQDVEDLINLQPPIQDLGVPTGVTAAVTDMPTTASVITGIATNVVEADKVKF